MMKGVYLGSKKHRIDNVDIVYNDIIKYKGIDLCCDMLDVAISKYDYVIATPPCNYYSRANYRRDSSPISLNTKHLLPTILKKLESYNKPFIVENVCNSSLLPKTNFIEFDFGQHHFYTNIYFLLPHKSFTIKQNKVKKGYGCRDDNYNVHIIINLFLESIGAVKL